MQSGASRRVGPHLPRSRRNFLWPGQTLETQRTCWSYDLFVISHGADELLALARGGTCTNQRVIRGWGIDEWRMTETDLVHLENVYRAVLLGDTAANDSNIASLLELQQVKLEALLLDDEGANDRLTRADAVELAGVASLLLADGWPPETLRMPNVPTLSRAKSESGNDAMAVRLDEEASGELTPDERLCVASIKHTIASRTSDVRLKLVRSVTSPEMTTATMARNLRPFTAWLKDRGMSQEQVERVYLFLRDWPDFNCVQIHAIAAIDVSQAEDFEIQLQQLPLVDAGTYRLRVLLIPDLANLHERLV
jgi:hypothetical protein